MSFQYPYAFFILLAIPVLIIIYLLRNKFKEATAPSTYLWEISKKFLKKRNPLHSLEHLLALIVQIATIAALAICLAHPTFTLPGKSDNILFVLDASASMRMENDEGTTCFDKAKEEIYSVATSSSKGSSFSLIYVADEPRIVCQGISDTDTFELYLDSLSVGNNTNDLTDVLTKAQEVIENSSINLCYLATDKKVTNLTNINLIDVSTDKDNYAITDLSYTYEDNTLTIDTNVISYMSDKNLKVDFYANGKEIGTRSYAVTKGENTLFELSYPDAKGDYASVESIKAVITNEDCLSIDNTKIIYNNDDVAVTKILIVSDDSFMLKSIFKAINNKTKYKNTIKVVDTSSYKDDADYDLYVFDSFTPDVLPTSGTIWFFNSSTTLEGTGFRAQRIVSDDDAVHLSYADNEDSYLYQSFTKDIAHNDIVVKKYVRYTLINDFTTILSYNNLPFVFAGKTDNNQREIVFAFDIHDSDISMKYDFTVLVRNALIYANPLLLDKYVYEVNDDMVLSISDNIDSLTITTPDGKVKTVEVNDDYVTYNLSKVGTYEANITYADGSKKNLQVYASFPLAESNPVIEDDSALVVSIDTTVKKGNGIFDNLLPVVILAAIFFLVDWGLYAYEQY